MNARNLRGVASAAMAVCAWFVQCAAGPSGSAADQPGNGAWVNISDPAVEQLVRSGAKIGWPGQTGGVAVDRTTGDVYMVICDNGLWKSSDRGKSFRRVDGGAIGGRCETGFALNLDPRGRRLACFMIYGGSAVSTDGGATWTPMAASHWDFGAVDWEQGGKSLVALEHHTDGTLGFSADAGRTWKKTDYAFARAVGVFDPKTFVRADDTGLFRSADGGESWTKVSDIVPTTNVVAVHRGTGYLGSSRGLVITKDRGATWSVLGSEIDVVFGPYFGKDESHLVVVTPRGIEETTDAAKSWNVVAPLAPEIGIGTKANKYRVGPNYAFDPVGNVIYASSMGKPTWKYERK